MPIAAFYASLLVPLFITLAARVSLARRRARIALGDGGDTELLRRIRVHANFVEYSPLTLVLLALAESLGADARFLHGAGLLLLGGRATHAFGMSQLKENLRLRVTAMTATYLSLAALAVACFYLSATRAFGF